MPPAFNLSQDQTLQFNSCYCFLFSRIGRSLNVLTSSSHLPVSQKTLKTYLNTSVRLDTFAHSHFTQKALRSPHKIARALPLSSAHTYRLLVVKEHSPNRHRLEAFPPLPNRPLFASLLVQHRNEIMKNLFLLVNKFVSVCFQTYRLWRPLVSLAALVAKRGDE